MKFSSLIAAAALPALAVAQAQIPLMDQAKGWFEKGKSYVESAVGSAATAPVRAAAAKVAGKTVHQLHIDDWRDVIKHSGTQTPYNSPEAWMVYVTGGNKTCFGHCGRADRAWNESVALFAADRSAPNLAVVNCETDEVLCGAWMANVPSVAVFIVPQPLPDQSPAPTNLYWIGLNMTGVTASDITKIHTRKIYLNMEPYEGALHPIDGWVAKYGLTLPIAYFLHYFSKIPSWAMMIGISMFSRSFMSRRMAPPPPQRRPGTAPAQS